MWQVRRKWGSLSWGSFLSNIMLSYCLHVQKMNQSFFLVQKSPKLDNDTLFRWNFAFKNKGSKFRAFLLLSGRVSPKVCILATVLMVVYKKCHQLSWNPSQDPPHFCYTAESVNILWYLCVLMWYQLWYLGPQISRLWDSNM